jgi:hypothetical protein
MRVLFLGNKERGTRCLETLIESDHEVCGVVSPPETAVEDWYRVPTEVAEKADWALESDGSGTRSGTDSGLVARFRGLLFGGSE